MPIGFNEIPKNLRVPNMYVEIDNSNAVNGAALMPYRVLACGQKLATGTQPVLTPVRITSPAQAALHFGVGSMLAQVCTAYIKVDSMTELWAVAVEDDATGVAATGTVTITGAATEGGTLCLYLGGRKVKAGVTTGMQASAVATALAAAVNALPDSPCTATVNAGVVTLTAKHKGLAGNGIDVRLNYYAETTPAGIAVATTALTGGATNPEVDELIAAMGDEHYNVICWPWLDAQSLAAIEAELVDRWGPLRMIEGVAVSAATGTHGTLGTLGDSRNSPHLCIMHTHGSPSLPWEMAAAVAAVTAFYGNIDPARPFQTLPMAGILPPAEPDRFTLQENNLLLYDGISTFYVDAGGVVRVQRLITTYKTSPAGAEDVSYLDVCTPLTVGYIRYDWRNYILRKYPRHKLADDGIYAIGQPIMTPKLGKAESIVRARVWADLGLVENVDEYAKAVVSERSLTDRTRLDWRLPPDLINQFIVGATQIQFIL